MRSACNKPASRKVTHTHKAMCNTNPYSYEMDRTWRNELQQFPEVFCFNFQACWTTFRTTNATEPLGTCATFYRYVLTK